MSWIILLAVSAAAAFLVKGKWYLTALIAGAANIFVNWSSYIISPTSPWWSSIPIIGPLLWQGTQAWSYALMAFDFVLGAAVGAVIWWVVRRFVK